MKTEKLKLALFDTGHGCRNVAGEYMEGYKGWARVSEYNEVSFVLLPESDVISNHIQSIDKEIKTIMENAMKQVDELKQKKAELLALPCDQGK